MKNVEDKSLIRKIEEERQKLANITLAELSRPDIISRQQDFDRYIVEYMRKKSGSGGEKASSGTK